MNVLDAAHTTVREYPGGAAALAARMGTSAAMLNNKVDPGKSSHHLYVQEATTIMLLSKDYRILHAMAAELGFSVTLQPVDLEPAHGNGVLSMVLDQSAADGEFARVVGEALADGQITENERREILAAGGSALGAKVSLILRLSAMANRRAQGAGA